MDEGGPGRNMYFEGCFGEEDAEAAAQRVSIVKERDALRFALKGLHDDVAEYARINHLGGFNNHWMKAARDALGENPCDLQTRLDALGVAIADAGYTWTPAMRAAYEGDL